MPKQPTFVTFRGHILEVDPIRNTDDDHTEGSKRSGAVAAPDAMLATNGRTYHGYNPGSYYLPNDAVGLETTSLSCAVVLTMRLDEGGTGPPWYSTLILQTSIIIDIGPRTRDRAKVCSRCRHWDRYLGNTIWYRTITLTLRYTALNQALTCTAEKHPESIVIGSDLSCIQPASPPPNCSFVQHDVERDSWASFGRLFDYIHLRFVITCFDDTHGVIRRCFENLRPGGYIELMDVCHDTVDFDGSARGSSFERWHRETQDAWSNRGRDFNRSKQYPGWCRDVGFVDVTEELLPVPLGSWPKDPRFKTIGRQWMLSVTRVLGALGTSFLSEGSVPDEFEKLEEAAMRDCHDPNIHLGFVM
ncbi:methyltransferase domain-containing protein [Purpureocillium lilacinum]|uniref:Methyltransferase domain-containing protein n=1 Tax=Purpureocillium lilacinum TaxID=33203 RepID=A0A2U3EHH3_PURLI|nr:methyltransferase domain-containing protein [Purpureocillium lilacinum]